MKNANLFISMIFAILVGVGFSLLTANIIIDHMDKEFRYYDKQFKRLELIQEKQDSINQLHNSKMDTLMDLHPKLPIDFAKKSNIWTWIRKERVCPYTVFRLDGGVDGRIDIELLAALMDMNYVGDAVTVTSIKRNWSIKSYHWSGRAIDIRWDDNSKKLASWLNSEDGRDWLAAYGIKFQIENVPEKEWRDSELGYVYNKHATGPHIHLEKRWST